MAPERPVPDANERRRALDPERSVIVQAPAGSGKTELLIQRFLALLARVDSPEEVIATTFTRKAAAEMRSRVLDAIADARRGKAPESEHEARTLEFARAVVARDTRLGWNIDANAARLRIQTIDSLALELARQMPVLSCLGAQPGTEEKPQALYAEAARSTLARLEGGDEPMPSIQRLLEHLDNDAGRAEDMLAEMLGRREHWLRHLGRLDRAALERALVRQRARVMREALAQFPDGLREETLALARYAVENLDAVGIPTKIGDLVALGRFPGEADEEAWLGACELALTKAGGWRKKFTLAEGFPPGANRAEKPARDAWKDRAKKLVEVLRANEKLALALARVRAMPPAQYDPSQWEALEAFTRLLPHAVSELLVAFASRRAVDYAEFTQRALRAMGTPDAPTDLALALDYRIRHLLIDEFQDTSISQFELVERLVAGWEPGDGRTLFVVGDPMQSIYGFREAEVGLFLRAWKEGIGGVSLEPVALSANFRSRRGVVDWVNKKFPLVMPAEADEGAGAVPFTASDWTRDPAPGEAVTVHPFFDGNREGEAHAVVEIVRGVRAVDAEATIAILVRNRNALRSIVPALAAAGLQAQAIKIDALASRPVVQDLLALTEALEHFADRLAWLAILRAPWCGLTLADLHALAGHDERTVWEELNDDVRLAAVSVDGRARLARLRDVLGRALATRRRVSLRDRVERAWLDLGGPACVESPTDLEDARLFLDLVSSLEIAGRLAEPERFEEGLAGLYALPDAAADPNLQIMTIHNAKGLEFDHVIVPGLDKRGGGGAKPLLRWIELPSRDALPGTELLIAPVAETGAESDRIFAWIEMLGEERERNENSRLLYVAATRARERLHLMACAGIDRKPPAPKLREPSKDLLLGSLWAVVREDFERAMPRASPPTGGRDMAALPQSISRLPVDWKTPQSPASVRWSVPDEVAREIGSVEYSWAGQNARRVGVVAHRWFQRIAEDELAGWDRARIESIRPRLRRSLEALGLSGADLDGSTNLVEEALVHAVTDARGRWVLGPQSGARSEYRLTALTRGAPRRVVIDRTFIERDRRWIVDFKTSGHEGAGLEEFLDSERERYRQQLDDYAAALGDASATRGLYFPLVGGWREWS